MAALFRYSKSSTISSLSSISLFRRCFSSAVAAELSSPTTTTLPFNLNHNLPRKDPKDRNVQWVFLGCPGVGKGTYASRLCNLLGIPHIATGDLVREELASSSPLSRQLSEIVNQGKLVSDEIIINLLSKRLEAGEAKGESGFILDGFPRTIRQAEILEEVIDIDLVVNLKLREDVLLEKCLGRRICGQCGKNFNLASINVKGVNGNPGMSMPPLLPPTHCMSKLITRADDTETVVKERLQVYNEKSQPVEEYYRSRGKLLEFDLPGGIPESWPKLLKVLNLDDFEEKLSAAA
ncbi:adenylate kinase 1, chloroplastic-like [Cucurbita pepo subsp. pepo]|uniref:adenylate kinase 1, chloroplastic-like n=1 Tax=Cucurbita pepo subsp. pepo TaxID=3664 RepID=UPI000C9D3694|nr:adenylate kinase 1, chloroplastic-like [Cucurbita pepo subsp. pepo]